MLKRALGKTGCPVTQMRYIQKTILGRASGNKEIFGSQSEPETLFLSDGVGTDFHYVSDSAHFHFKTFLKMSETHFDMENGTCGKQKHT